MINIGFDIGSRNTKIVIYDSSHSCLVYSKWSATDVKPLNTVSALLSNAHSSSIIGLQENALTGVTGYGRKLLSGKAKVFSEISCHTKGVCFFYPNARTIIDIGGQDSKIILVNDHGKVEDFVMNDKCAAGTGRFLEMTAMRIGLSVEQLNDIQLVSKPSILINSTCVVFAESEIISLIADNASVEDITQAVYSSITRRILAQLNTMTYKKPIVFTGGVAQSMHMVECLKQTLETDVLVPPQPEITGALGAAILVSI